MRKFLIILTILSIFSMSVAVLMDSVQAAGLSAVKDTMTRQKASTLSNHTIQFTTTTGVAAGGTIVITFPSDFIGEADIDFTDVDMYAVTERTLAAAPNVATWGAVFSDSGSTRNRLTLTSGTGTVVAGGTVIIEIGTNATEGVAGNKQITNATTTGSKTVTLSVGGTDTGTLAIPIATEDQVSSSGTVDPYLAFNVTDATIAFGTLSLTAITTNTAEMTAATNSTSGYNITIGINGADTATLDDGAGHTITAIGAVATASIPGTEQYGMKIGVAGGSGAAVAPYATADYALDTAAFPDICASSAGVSITTTYTMTYMANIATNTEPGTYTARHTYIATGNF